MPELDTQLIYAIDRSNDAAWSAYLKIVDSGPRPGAVIPLSAEEFAAIKSGSIVLAIPAKKAS